MIDLGSRLAYHSNQNWAVDKNISNWMNCRMANAYQAENITVLEGLEAVRKRPGMYIGNTGKEGLHRCLGEILDNAVDEFMAGYGTSAKVVLDKDFALVADDGRGIPIDIHPKTGRSAVETIMTILHAGGKFDQKNYQFSGGLHGVGASVVNALSARMQVFVLRDGLVHFIEFQQGKTVVPLESMTQEDFGQRYPQFARHTVWQTSGTLVAFWPDKTIFETTDFDLVEIDTLLKNTAYLNAHLHLYFAPSLEAEAVEYHFPQGIRTYLEDLTAEEQLLIPIVQIHGKEPNFQLDIAFTYSSQFTEKLFAYTNGIFNAEGGMHVTGFRTALTRVINNYASDKGLLKKDERFSAEDLREGLRVILSVKMIDPQFTSQSKVKLGSTIARTYTDKILSEKLAAFLEENPKEAQAIIQKAQLAMKARIAAKAARETVLRKGVLENLALPGKLSDCSEKDPAKSEIFIVEGDSAGGSAKQGRDRHTQAILPLRGKVLNTEKATLDKIMNYEGIKNMIIALGTGVGATFDISKLRYHKIILMTDADVDGAHITTLLLTFFYRYMPALIDEGYVYMARPPLYRISWGKHHEYVYSDAEKEAILQKLRAQGISTSWPDGSDVTTQASESDSSASFALSRELTTSENTNGTKKITKVSIQRYKGLGEMNAEQLWETTMNPATRLLYQVTVGEAAVADRIFDELMGADVEPRKRFIEENAMFVEVEMI